MTETKSRQMKPSGVPWLGDIPAGWVVSKVKSEFVSRKTIAGKAAPNYQRLALTMQGVVQRSKEDANGLQPEQFEGYQILEENELVFKLIDLQNIPTSRVGRSPFTGLVSPAYIVLHHRFGKSTRYAEYYFLSMWLNQIFNQLGGDAVRSCIGQNELLNLPYLRIDEDEQRAIADFLDEKCAAIDAIVEEAKSGIEEYAKWKQSVVFQAVTKGLDPHVKMKDSGVDIIGEMPMKWDLRRLRFICSVSTGNQDTQNSVPDGQYPFFVRSPIVERSNAFTFDGMAVLMAGDGAGAGKVFHIYSGKMAIHQRVYCFHEFKDVRPKFFFYFMQNRFGVEIDKGSAKSTVPSVRLPMLLDFRVCLPSIEEQDRIVEHLDEKCSAIDALIEEKKQLIEDLGVYKKSLIYETVTGKRKIA